MVGSKLECHYVSEEDGAFCESICDGKEANCKKNAAVLIYVGVGVFRRRGKGRGRRAEVGGVVSVCVCV